MKNRSLAFHIGWWTMLILAIGVAGYAASILINGIDNYDGGLAESFQSRPWGIIPHALFGLIALAIGPLQFHSGLRTRRLNFHRALGKTYVVAALLSSAAGLYMALYAFGGIVTMTGFGMMALATLLTTTMAYVRIRGLDIDAHQEWMTRSYALLFSAVTLRIWLPILMNIFDGDFRPTYLTVAWLSWVPNLLVAEWINQRRRSGKKISSMQSSPAAA